MAITFATSYGHLKKGFADPAVKGLQNKENRPRMISELFRINYKDKNGFITAAELAEETEEISEYSQQLYLHWHEGKSHPMDGFQNKINS